MSAKQLIIEHLASCLPPGVPASYQCISGARLAGYGKGRRAIGDLVMFDGKPARIEVLERDGVRSHRWIEVQGGAVSFKDGRWQREMD